MTLFRPYHLGCAVACLCILLSRALNIYNLMSVLVSTYRHLLVIRTLLVAPAMNPLKILAEVKHKLHQY